MGYSQELFHRNVLNNLKMLNDTTQDIKKILRAYLDYKVKFNSAAEMLKCGVMTEVDALEIMQNAIEGYQRDLGIQTPSEKKKSEEFVQKAVEWYRKDILTEHLFDPVEPCCQLRKGEQHNE